MSDLIIDEAITALLVIDPYNDFISEGGKAWDRVKTTAESNRCVPHMVRSHGSRAECGGAGLLRPASPLPSRRLRDVGLHGSGPGASVEDQVLRVRDVGRRDPEGFEPQSGDVVAHEHWGSSGFANTDLDQQLKLHGIRHLIVIGLLANTCVEATVRFAAELGYKPTVVKDATASLAPRGDARLARGQHAQLRGHDDHERDRRRAVRVLSGRGLITVPRLTKEILRWPHPQTGPVSPAVSSFTAA